MMSARPSDRTDLAAMWLGLAIGLALCAGLAAAIGLLSAGSWFAATVSDALAACKTPKDRLDALYDVASISVPLIALVAGVAAWSQVREAKSARVATLYLQINERFNAEIMREARLASNDLWELSTWACPDPRMQSQFISSYLSGLSGYKRGSNEYRICVGCKRVIEFWEEMAVLVNKGLVEENVIFEYYASHIGTAKTRFEPYMRSRQVEVKSPTIFANALELMDKATNAKIKTY